MSLAVTINGEEKQLDGPVSIAGLLARLHLPPEKVAVERNLDIVPRARFGATALEDGDRIEIVHFIGGGS